MTKEVVTAAAGELSPFQVLREDTGAVLAAIKENAGDSGFTEFDLEKVRIPSGGGIAFEVENLEGTDVVKDIQGIIVLHRSTRAYYEKSFDDGGGGQPPDCWSPDTVKGVGKPGGDCSACPLGQFGSDKDGRGQACKQMKQVFLLRENGFFPILVSLPPTSLKAVRQYLLRIGGQGVAFHTCVTKISLEKAQSATGISYAKAKFTFVRHLNEEEAAKSKQYHEMLKPLVERAHIDSSYVAASSDPEGEF